MIPIGSGSFFDRWIISDQTIGSGRTDPDKSGVGILSLSFRVPRAGLWVGCGIPWVPFGPVLVLVRQVVSGRCSGNGLVSGTLLRARHWDYIDYPM